MDWLYHSRNIIYWKGLSVGYMNEKGKGFMIGVMPKVNEGLAVGLITSETESGLSLCIGKAFSNLGVAVGSFAETWRGKAFGIFDAISRYNNKEITLTKYIVNKLSNLKKLFL